VLAYASMPQWSSLTDPSVKYKTEGHKFRD